MGDETGGKLSGGQRRILADLLVYYRNREEAGGNSVAQVRIWGVPLKWLRGTKRDRTAADSAAFSRSIRRLEARGLVLRNNSRNGVASGPSQGRARRSLEELIARADHLLLTEMGRLVAETVKINLG
jgi:hypothetical protein